MPTYPVSGVDLSYAQGHPNVAALPGSFVICNASRANEGLVVGSDYVWQADATRAAGKELGHYFFNGNVDPTACANFFVANLHDYKPGDALVLDAESEKATNTVAWSPSKVLAFAQQVKKLTGQTIGVYLNESLMNGANWTDVVDFGVWLWLAYPAAQLPPIHYWSHASIWQFTSTGGLDQNKAVGSLASITGSSLASVSAAPISFGDDMKIFKATNGTIALIGETYGETFSSTDFDEQANAAAWGPYITGLTQDQLTTLVNDANARGAALKATVVANSVSTGSGLSEDDLAKIKALIPTTFTGK